MLVKWTRGPVGAWTFEERSKRHDKFDRATLDDLLVHCQRIAVVLEEHELLRPKELVFFAWTPSQPGEPNTSVPLTGASQLVTSAKPVLDSVEKKRGFRNPTSVQVFGEGTLYGADGKPSSARNLVWFSATTLEFHMITVKTQGDAWLPFGLDGNPQPRLAEQNATRLEYALTAIRDDLGFDVVHDELTDYAVINGLTLKNQLDVQGAPTDVLYDRSVLDSE